MRASTQRMRLYIRVVGQSSPDMHLADAELATYPVTLHDGAILTLVQPETGSGIDLNVVVPDG